ncbi:hypothetical protein KATP_17980 [Kluyvera ascorbata]|nr:hypothetical protein KATP_17980 [Kluyvera ascorbata]
MPGIKKGATRLHHLGAITGVTGAFMLYWQEVNVSLFRPIELMTLRAKITIAAAR